MPEPPPPFPFTVPDGPDPAAEMGRLRAAGPVARVRLPSGTPAWLVTRYAENRRVLAGEEFSRAAAAAAGAPRLRRVPLEAGSITTLDPPEHTRLRRIVAGAFTHRRVEGLRPRVAAIADELLDGLLRGSPPDDPTADLVGGYARPLAMTVICALLGVPEPDRDRFAALSRAYLGGAGTRPEEIERSAAELRGYLAGLVARRRRDPSDDLLGTLVRARDDDRMTETELVALGLTILVAGFETAAGMIAGSVHALLRHEGKLPPQLADRDALRTAVEELLRYVAVSAAGGTLRVATADVPLGDVTVRAGEAVLPATTSANRDPAVFADPDRLDLARSPNPHLAFGHGPHHCLGAALARVEVEEALAALVRRVPALRLAVPDEQVRWYGGGMVRGPEELPVTW